MATPDAFAGKFKALLEEFPNNFSLPECQFLYRKVIFSMGLRILERFQDDLSGPDPFESDSAFDATEVLSNRPGVGSRPTPPTAGGGQAPGPAPSAFGGGQGPGIDPRPNGAGQGPGIDPCVVFVGVVLGVTPVCP